MSTTIQWTDETWNPVTGCRQISPGCANCYAKQLHDMRHQAFLNGKAMPEQYSVPFETVRLHPSRLEIPLRWRKPRRVFVNSMSDLFHESVTEEFLLSTFATMTGASEHTFQILTKRPERMRDFLAMHAAKISGDEPLPNVWLGVSIENRMHRKRLDILRKIPAAVRMVSFEPLLEDLGEVNLEGIGWVIVGGESGRGARPFSLDWARELIDQCRTAKVPVFIKQMGSRAFRGREDTRFIRDSKGGDMAEWPADLRIREFPNTTKEVAA